MKIVVRTRNFQIFLIFFSTFVLQYRNKLGDLIVLVQKDETNNISSYKALLKDYPEVRIQEVGQWEIDIEDNGWATMLYRSLLYDYVVSLDDDIVFTNPGLFDKIDEIFNKTNKEILSFSYKSNNFNELILSSYCICKRNAIITKRDFASLNKVREEYDGVDTAYLKFNHTYEFLDEHIVHKKNKNNNNFIVTPYFTHIGSISCLYNEVYDKLKDKK